MATKLVLIKINDITSGETIIFRGATYDVVSDTETDYNRYSAAGLLARYPQFAPEITYSGNINDSDLLAGLRAIGLVDLLPTDYFSSGAWNGHEWEMEDGTRVIARRYGTGNATGLRLEYNGEYYTLFPSYNQNVRGLVSPAVLNGNNMQFCRIFFGYSDFTQYDTYYLQPSRDTTYRSETLPLEWEATSDEIAFWTGKYSFVSGDPFTPGGESDSGGGTGNFDGTSVDVDFASLPTLSAVDTGFITLYNPTLSQLQSLANYMWSGLFDIDTFKKLFADPMQAILGLSIVPGPVPSGATQNVRIGNIDSGVSMTKAATQYIDIDCGTLNVEEFWGAYLDYEPYTKAEIFLPFIGVHQIAVDDIMNKSVHIMYHIDLLSGGCACEIKCGGSVLYTFIGSCAVSIPVTGSDWTNLINGVLSAASAIGTMVATGGATAPAAAGEIASAAVNSLKPSIEKSGSIAGAGGLLAGKVPVLILTRPRQALPTNQNTFTGYPAFITRSLGALSGYTEVHSIRLSGIDGTESEIDEIEELLKGGVIL